MPFMPWITRLVRSLVSAMSPKVQESRRLHSSRRLHRPIRAIGWALAWSLLLPGFVWAGNDGGKRTIVAAGFGHQVGEVSTITVKTYDVESGEILSDETYELNVKEDGIAKNSRLDERIFAGGVGPGATDLSNFILRVYDAKTGKFQWEGYLNLTPTGSAGATRLVATALPRRGTVTNIAAPLRSAAVPSFILRALDPVTGGLMWQDEFSTGSRLRMERIADRQAAGGEPAWSRPAFDFRIRMFESDGRYLLWEDQVTLGEDEDLPQPESVEDEARPLPTWPGMQDRDGAEERI